MNMVHLYRQERFLVIYTHVFLSFSSFFTFRPLWHECSLCSHQTRVETVGGYCFPWREGRDSGGTNTAGRFVPVEAEERAPRDERHGYVAKMLEAIVYTSSKACSSSNSRSSSSSSI